MIKDVDFFCQEIERQRKKNEKIKPANIVYGSNVMPILEMYKKLSTFDERESFSKALEMFLSDADPDKRHFGVIVCLGFFIFRDAI